MDTGSEDRKFQTEWSRVCSRLKVEIGETAFENWVKPIRACELRNTEVRLSVPSRFMRDWIIANYLERLKELWTAENSMVCSIDVFIQPNQKNNVTKE